VAVAYNRKPIPKEVLSQRAKKAAETRRIRNNNGHSEDTKALLSEKTSLAISEGRVSKVSQIENIVAEVLSNLKIEFIRQHPLRGNNGRFVASFDFWLPAHNIALEVNGTFWHSDPRIFPNGPIHPSQKRSASAWQRKIAHAAAMGISVREVWEVDIKESPKEAVLSAIGGTAA
jgi:G:T-mismatch repair DNA endonuclease (very short patch repair protein)